MEKCFIERISRQIKSHQVPKNPLVDLLHEGQAQRDGLLPQRQQANQCRICQCSAHCTAIEEVREEVQ